MRTTRNFPQKSGYTCFLLKKKMWVMDSLMVEGWGEGEERFEN